MGATRISDISRASYVAPTGSRGLRKFSLQDALVRKEDRVAQERTSKTHADSTELV